MCHRPKLEKLLGLVYCLDVYISVAAVANERKFIFPKALPGSGTKLTLEGVYHPELKTPVSNDFSMSPSRNVVFLTGANRV